MSQRSEEEVLLRSYLLGGLDEAARERVEERLLDDDFADRLSAAQDALIDDYVFDALSASERKSFDENFVIDDERRGKLLFARALEIYVDEHPGPPRPPAPRPTPPPQQKSLPSLRARKAASAVSAPPAPTPSGRRSRFLRTHKTATAVLAVVLLLLLLAPVLLWRLRTPDRATLLRERRAAAERRAAEVNRRPAAQGFKDLPASELVLLPLLRERGGLPRVVLNDDVKLLTLKLPPPQRRYESYDALVLTVGGDELFAVGGLAPEVGAGDESIPLNLPTEFLPAGDYQVQLRGAAAGGRLVEVGRYSFRVAYNE